MKWKKCSLTNYLREEDFYFTSILKSAAGWATLRCAFCKGQGSNLGTYGQCPYCGGRKVVTLPEPIARCAFCSGTGRMHAHREMVCIVCRGKGAVTVVEPLERCCVCNGTGRANLGWQLPCTRCSGKGITSSARESRRSAKSLQETESCK